MLEASAKQMYERKAGKPFDPEVNVAMPLDNLNMVWGIFDKNDMYHYYKVDNSGMFCHTMKANTDLAIMKELYEDLETPLAVVNDENNFYIYLITNWVGGDKVGVMTFSKTTYKKASQKGQRKYKKFYTDKKGTYIKNGHSKIYFELA